MFLIERLKLGIFNLSVRRINLLVNPRHSFRQQSAQCTLKNNVFGNFSNIKEMRTFPIGDCLQRTPQKNAHVKQKTVVGLSSVYNIQR